ncbi:MAG TPA: hypothetical protein VFZ21_30840 [Gemmatimonadaceae bacterium]|nr:hypothetical protein [Gemmatimonadaceae bacterium]
MTDEKLREAIARLSHYLDAEPIPIEDSHLVLSAASSWLKLVPVRGNEVTEAGLYILPSEELYRFNGKRWLRPDGEGDMEYCEAPEWAIPWGALPAIPKETTDDP